MSNVAQFAATKTIANATTAGNTELVVAVLAGVAPPRPDARVDLRAWASVTTGASVTSGRLRIYRGADATGTLVADSGVVAGGVAASTLSTLDCMGEDAAPGAVANQSYALTLTTAGGGAGNSTVGFVRLLAIVFF